MNNAFGGFNRRTFIIGAGAVGAGIVLTTGTAEAAVTVNVKTLGATGNGTTDDGPAIRQAVAQVNTAGGGTVYFPTGTYRYVTTGVLSLGANVTLLGDGATKSVIAYEGANESSFAQNSGDNVTIKSLTVQPNVDFDTSVFLVLSHDGFTFDGVTIDGRRDVLYNSYLYGIQLGTDNGTATHLKLINGTKLTKCNYGLLQLEPSTATTRYITVTNCTFTQNLNDDLEFNAPAGLMDQILVDTCTFSTNHQTVQGSGFAVGLAHCTNATVQNCSFTDYYHEAVHVENQSQNIKILTNTFTKIGQIQFADIQVVSGTDTVLIQDNTFNSTDTKGANYAGVVVCNQGGALTNPTNITVDHNQIKCGANNGVVFQVDTGAVTNNVFTTTDAAHDYVDWGSTNITISGNTPPP